MTVTMPEGVSFCRVHGHWIEAVRDGPDSDPNPDAKPLTGTVTLTPVVTGTGIVKVGSTGMVVRPITVTIVDGRVDFYVVASVDQDTNPQDWTYRVDVRFNGGGSYFFHINAPADGDVDLITATSVAGSGGAWVTQGPEGPGFSEAEIVGDSLVLTRTTGDTIDLGTVVGRDGEPGAPGMPGVNAVPADEAVAAYIAGATETATALADRVGIIAGVVDDDMTDNRAAIQACLDRGGAWRLPHTSGRYAISGALMFTVAGTELHHRNAPIRQTVIPDSVHVVDAPDVVIEGEVVGQVGPLDLTGMFSTAWESTVIASKLAGINAYSNAHRMHVPYLRAEGFSAGIRVTNWDLATESVASTHIEDVNVEELHVRNVEFGMSARGTDRFRWGRVVGGYRGPIGGKRPPHLLYFAGDDADNTEVAGGYGLAVWEGGTTEGQAFQFKGVSGGNLGVLVARGCPGALNLMDCTGWTVDLESTGDLSTGEYGSVSISRTGLVEPFGKFTRMDVVMASDGVVYRALNGDGISFPNGMSVIANHTTTGSSTAFDIEIRGTNCDVASIRYDNAGPNAWRAVALYSGAGHRIGSADIRNARVGLEVRATATDATVGYDPRRVTLHPTGGLRKIMVSIGAAATLRTPFRPTDNNVGVADNFTWAPTSGTAPGPALTGQAWTVGLGTWATDTDAEELSETGGGNGANLYTDTGYSDADLRAQIKLTGRPGFVIRRIDGSSYLVAYMSTTGVVIGKRVGGSITTLQAAAAAYQSGRWYDFRVQMFDNVIDAYVDGLLVVSHTLDVADSATFAAQTTHGFFSSASAGTRWRKFRALKP